MFQIRILSILTALMALVSTSAYSQNSPSLEKMGGSISDAETQDEIFLSCTEFNRDQECAVYQFYLKTGDFNFSLGKKLLPVDFKNIYDSFNQKIMIEISKMNQTPSRARWQLRLFWLTNKVFRDAGFFGVNAFQSSSVKPNRDHFRIGGNLLACLALGLIPFPTYYTASLVTIPIDLSVAVVKTPIVLLRNTLVAINNSQNKKDIQKSSLKLTTAIKNTYDQKLQTTLITHAEFNTLKAIIETQLK